MVTVPKILGAARVDGRNKEVVSDALECTARRRKLANIAFVSGGLFLDKAGNGPASLPPGVVDLR